MSFTTGPIRVTYRDTDQMGHVYHANYLVWFEIGRTEMLRNIGRAYSDWETVEKIFLPVTSCWIDYKLSACYDELIRVETSVTHASRAAMTFEYKILRGHAVLAQGGTRHAFIRPDGSIARVGHLLMPELFPNG